MSVPQHHVIRRQIVDIALQGDEREGVVLQDRLATLCRDWLTPALEEVFTRTAPVGEHWAFEHIEIDVGHFTPDTLERDFVAAVQAAIANEIQARKNPLARQTAHSGARAQQRTPAQALHEVFLCFLATGMLPWWYRLPKDLTLEKALDKHWDNGAPPVALCDALRRRLRSADVRTRLARQFPTPWLIRLVEGMAPGFTAILQHAHGKPLSTTVARNGSTPSLPEAVWQTIFMRIATGQVIAEQALHRDRFVSPPPDTERASKQARPDHHSPLSIPSSDPDSDDATHAVDHATLQTADGTALPHSIDKPAMSDASHTTPGRTASERDATRPGHTTSTSLDLTEGLFVDAAGVVLLHPFLPTLFERLGVACDQQLLQPGRALALMHFLATGETSAPEYDLVLPKLLCGLDIRAPAPAPVELTAAEQSEALDLLTVTIKHWEALGDASPDALRGTFLVRPGKLFKRSDEEVLQLETQAFDVLLGKLPWGISPVHLPWMPRLLWVEWPF